MASSVAQTCRAVSLSIIRLVTGATSSSPRSLTSWIIRFCLIMLHVVGGTVVGVYVEKEEDECEL